MTTVDFVEVSFNDVVIYPSKSPTWADFISILEDNAKKKGYRLFSLHSEMTAKIDLFASNSKDELLKKAIHLLEDKETIIVDGQSYLVKPQFVFEKIDSSSFTKNGFSVGFDFDSLNNLLRIRIHSKTIQKNANYDDAVSMAHTLVDGVEVVWNSLHFPVWGRDLIHDDNVSDVVGRVLQKRLIHLVDSSLEAIREASDSAIFGVDESRWITILGEHVLRKHSVQINAIPGSKRVLRNGVLIQSDVLPGRIASMYSEHVSSDYDLQQSTFFRKLLEAKK
jgi:hypothetical protein